MIWKIIVVFIFCNSVFATVAYSTGYDFNYRDAVTGVWYALSLGVSVLVSALVAWTDAERTGRRK